MNEFPITNTEADTIRARFVRCAAESRASADQFEAAGDHESAAHCRHLAESQDRMSAKRYEAMRVVGRL